jgi:hypothetical protein
MKRILMIVLSVWMASAGFAEDPAVKFVRSTEKIEVWIDTVCVATWLFRPEMAKPVLYPLRSRSGLVLTRHYPLGKLEGESNDHPHHAGLFFSFDGVNGMKRDRFWTAVKPPPQILPVKTGAHVAGDGRGTLTVESHWNGDSGRTVLTEKRIMVFSPVQGGYTMDFTLTLTATDSAVVFEDTKEGLFAIRVGDWMTEKTGSGRYLSSRGGETEAGVWGRRAEWVRLEAEKGGRRAGIAIFDHTQSVNHPTYWQARAYGLFSADPLGQLDFQKTLKSSDPKPFDLVLQPDQNACFKYLVLVYDGSRTKEDLDSVYQTYLSRQRGLN